MSISTLPLRTTRLRPRFRHPGPVALAVAFVAALAYLPALTNGFAYDDAHVLLENPDLRSLRSLPQAVLRPYWHGHEGELDLGLWRPTTTLVLGLEYAVAGEAPGLYHAVNVVAHAGVSALLVLLLWGTLPPAVAGTAGLLFALHPVHVEAVANVVGVSELLAALFILLALRVHLGGAPTPGRAMGVAVLGALALGAKESAAVLPALLLLTDAARHRMTLREVPGYLVRNRWTYGLLAGALGVLLWVRWRVLGSVARASAALGAGLLAEVPRIWTLAQVWAHQLRLMVWPWDLSVDYSPDVIPVALGPTPLAWSGLAAVLGLLAMAWWSWRRGAWVPAFGVLWFAVAVLPVSNVFFLTGVLLAERTLYLPSVGPAVLLAWVLLRLAAPAAAGASPRRRWLRLPALAALVALPTLFAVRTWTRAPVWASDASVFGSLLAEHPEAGRARWMRAGALLDAGRRSDALLAYREAIPALGASSGLLVEIGRGLLSAGDLRGAEHLLRRAREMDPAHPTPPALLGVIYARQQRWGEAVPELEAALTLRPHNVVSRHLLATAYAELGRWEASARERRRVIEEGEDVWQQWLWLAEAEAHAGRLDEAEAALAAARARAPDEGARAEVARVREELLGAR